jgi:hypothetical protein
VGHHLDKILVGQEEQQTLLVLQLLMLVVVEVKQTIQILDQLLDLVVAVDVLVPQD